MSPTSAAISRRSLLAGVAGLGGATLLAGCRRPGTSAIGGTTSPKPGGTAVLAQSADIAPTSVLAQNLPNLVLQRLVWNTLTEYDHKTLTPKPSLATDWSWSADRRTLTVNLRSDVTFHSGRPFGPKDVVDAIERQASPPTGLTAGQLKAAAAAVTGVEATGANQVTIHLSHPVTNFFDLFEAMYILDSESISDLVAGTSFVGTGPFRFGSRSPGVSLSLKKNDKYWQSGRPYLDGVEIRVVSQPDAMVSALRSAQIHLASNLPGSTVETLRDNKSLVVTALDTQDACWYVGCNVSIKPLDNKTVRQAVAYGVDRQKVLADALGGIGKVTSIPWSSTSPAYDSAHAGTYSFNPQKAKSLLASAGATGTALHIAVNAGQSVTRGIAEALQYSLQQSGFTVTIDSLQDADFTARLTGAKMPGLWVASHGFGQMSPATLLTGAYPFNSAKNASNFVDPQYATLAGSVFEAASDAAAKSAYSDVTGYLLDQQFVVDMVSSSYTYVTQSLQGIGYTMLDFLNLDDAYVA
ncbi:ABC transporter substrate-binding protein [Rugosimonospora acidiphila]|uniref:ABC transporter substrate-binding protein n=1 Tax=Rugosimonospora acidiphila TaxID=556531 RepID=A0ABP9RIX8_9ACTN